jgi:hypothetical protein
MTKYRFTDDEFIAAVKNSKSICNTLSLLGMCFTGGAYKTFHDRANKLNLDTSHFTGQSHHKGKFYGPKRPITDYFEGKSEITSHALRLRLIKEGIKQAKCEQCLNTEWNGVPISLELDHINGIHADNRLDNLRILCPNCHAQTPTHRCRNWKKKPAIKQPKIPLSKQPILCPSCSGTMSSKSSICKHCVVKPTKITWPSNEELIKLVWEKPTSRLARELGVSDNAIKHRCKLRGIAQPPRGYWAKKAAGTL